MNHLSSTRHAASRIGSVLLALLAVLFLPGPWALASPQTAESARSETALDGLAHTDVYLRLVTESGEPAEGIEVSWVRKDPGFTPARSMGVWATSDAQGRVRFENLTSMGPVQLRMAAQRGLRSRYLVLPSMCGGEMDLGEISLEKSLVVDGTVLIADAENGAWTPLDIKNGRVELLTRGETEDPVASTRVEDGAFRFNSLRRVPVWIDVRYDRNWQTPPARIAWDPNQLEGQVALQLRIQNGLLEIADQRAGPTPPLEPERTFEGRVLWENGQPAVGLPVRLSGRWVQGYPVRHSRGWTDGAGRFSLRTRSATLERVLVEYPGGFRNFGPGVDGSADAPDPTQLEAILPIASHLNLDVHGLDDVERNWEVLGFEGWYTVEEDVAKRVSPPSQGGRGLQRTLRVGAPGRVPRLVDVGYRDQEIEVEFGEGLAHELLVVDGDGPVQEAQVDVLLRAGEIHDIVFKRGLEGRVHLRDSLLASYRVDSEGRLSLLADEDQILFARVTAPGHEPRVTRFRPGVETVELEQRSVPASLGEFPSGTTVRVKRSGTDELVGFTRATKGRAVQFHLPPNRSFEVSLTDAQGQPLGASVLTTSEDTFEWARDDVRPRVTISLPELPPVPLEDRRWYEDEEGDPAADTWWVWAERGTPVEGASSPMMSSIYDGTSSRERPATVREIDSRTFELLLSGGGPWTITAGSRRTSLDGSFFAEVDLEMGEYLSLELPPLLGKLRGSSSALGPEQFISHHGIAGPRLGLFPLPSAGVAFGALFHTPPMESGDPSFEIGNLPPGDYLLHHHLTSDDKSPLGSRRIHVDAVAVEVEDFEAWPTGSFDVRVLDSDGQAVTDGWLTVRDRLSEAWIAFCRQPTTGVFATNPLPPAPVYRLRTTPTPFEGVQLGWMEFRVTRDDGRRWTFLREVSEGSEIVLTLPK